MTLVILTLVTLIVVPSVMNALNKADSDGTTASIGMIERAGAIARTSKAPFDDRVGVGPGYRVDYLINNDYLQLPMDDPLVHSNSYVSLDNNGQMVYQGSGLRTDENNLLIKANRDFVIEKGTGFKSVYTDLKPVAYTLSYDYELLEADPTEGPPSELLIYTRGASNDFRTNYTSIHSDSGHVEMTFIPGVKHKSLFLYGDRSNRASLLNKMKFSNVHLKQLNTQQLFRSTNGVQMWSNNNNTVPGKGVIGKEYSTYYAEPGGENDKLYLSSYTNDHIGGLDVGTKLHAIYEVYSPVDTELRIGAAGDYTKVPANTWVRLTAEYAVTNKGRNGEDRIWGILSPRGYSPRHLGVENGVRVRNMEVRLAE